MIKVGDKVKINKRTADIFNVSEGPFEVTSIDLGGVFIRLVEHGMPVFMYISELQLEQEYNINPHLKKCNCGNNFLRESERGQHSQWCDIKEER